MKRLTFIAILFGTLGLNAQQGTLVPDTLHILKDTVYGKVLYFKGMATAVDSSYAVRHQAPLVFKSTDKSLSGTKTDKTQIVKVVYYLLPSRKELDAEDIISFKTKRQ